MFIPQCNSTQESWKSLVCWSSPMLSPLPGPSLLPFRWDVGRQERERNMLSLLTWIRRPSLFVCSYWDLALIVPGDPFQKEKERWSAWRRRRAVQCGLFWHIHVTLVGRFRIWKLCLTLSCPKCRSFKRDGNTAASHCGNREGQQGSWACLMWLLPFPGAWANILPSQKLLKLKFQRLSTEGLKMCI